MRVGKRVVGLFWKMGLVCEGRWGRVRSKGRESCVFGVEGARHIIVSKEGEMRIRCDEVSKFTAASAVLCGKYLVVGGGVDVYVL